MTQIHIKLSREDFGKLVRGERVENRIHDDKIFLTLNDFGFDSMEWEIMNAKSGLPPHRLIPRGIVNLHECANCSAVLHDDELKHTLASGIPHLEERLDAGGVVPSGECPKCSALTYMTQKVGEI